MDPAVIGYGIPAGGRIEVELGGGFKRDPAIPVISGVKLGHSSGRNCFAVSV